MNRPGPSPTNHELEARLYRRLLGLLPRELVLDHGDDMVALFVDHLEDARGSIGRRVSLWLRAVADLVRHGWALQRRFRRSRIRQGTPIPGDPSMKERLETTLSALSRDTTYALRLLRKDWSFTLTATLILALAIGANTAVFSFVDTYLLRPLPYPEPDRLAIVTRVFESGGVGVSQDGFTWEAIEASDSDAFQAAVYSGWGTRVNLATGSSAVNVAQQRVGSGYFATLGVRPMLGREFTAGEDVPDGAPVTILSHGLWQRLFDGDQNTIGESVMLRGEPHTVVGVMPPDFRSSAEAELWAPLRPNTTGEGGGTNYSILLRLNSETAWSQAEGSIAAIGRSMLEGNYPGGRFEQLALQRLQETDTAALRTRLQILWISVGAILLISCVNVSGLMLVRGNRRSREIATRLALGGGRGAILRQLLVESVVLAVLGGAAGLLLARSMMGGLEMLGRGVLDSWRPIALDGRVLAMSVGATLLTALLFGLAPAVQAARVGLHDALRAGGRAASRQGSWARRLLVVAEVGLSVVLLVMAGLLLRTFIHFQSLEPGFEPDGLVTFSVSLQDARYRSAADVVGLFEEGIRRAEALPATVSATAALGLPYERQLNLGFAPIDFELDESTNRVTNVVYVSPGYFETLQTRILQGRSIDERDDGEGPPVALVNEAFVAQFMAGTPPLERTVGIAGRERRIVGVSANIKHSAGFGTFEPVDDVPTVYVAASQLADGFFPTVHTWFGPSWIVRVNGDPGAVIPTIEREFASIDPLLPLADVRLASEVQSQSLAQQRFIAVLVVALATASVLLAGLGIWGLVASTVVEQRREIGIRMALGAGPRNAISVVAGPSIRLAAVGAALGIGLSFLASRVLTSVLWGVTPTDPLTYVTVAGVLLLAAAVASLLPASRAARVDPARTLQAD